MEKSDSYVDYWGITASSLCLVHCLVFPIILGLGQISKGFLGEALEWLEYVFWIGSLWAVYNAAKKANNSTRLAFGLFFACLTLAIFGEEWHPQIEYLAYVGSLGLIATHTYHIFWCQHCLKTAALSKG